MVEIELERHGLHLPQKPVTKEKPEVPAKQHETEDRKADRSVVPSSAGQVHSRPVIQGIPGRYRQQDALLPYPMSDRDHQDEQSQLHPYGIPQAHGGGNNAVETSLILGRDQA